MKCQDVLELIVERAGLSLGPEAESHLSGCPACSKVHLEQQALWRALEAFEAPEVSPAFDSRLFARLQQRNPTWAAWDWLGGLLGSRRPAYSAVLAGMLMVATIVAIGRRLPPPPVAVAGSASQAQQAEQIEQALQDFDMLLDFEGLLQTPQAGN